MATAIPTEARAARTLIAGRLGRWAAFAALVHGVVPCLHETTASSEVLAMNDEIRARRALMATGADARAIAQ